MSYSRLIYHYIRKSSVLSKLGCDSIINWDTRSTHENRNWRRNISFCLECLLINYILNKFGSSSQLREGIVHDWETLVYQNGNCAKSQVVWSISNNRTQGEHVYHRGHWSSKWTAHGAISCLNTTPTEPLHKMHPNSQVIYLFLFLLVRDFVSTFHASYNSIKLLED